MTESAVVFSYVVTYGFMAAYLVRLALRDRRLSTRIGTESGDRQSNE